MVAKFSSQSWRDILRVCGSVSMSCPNENDVCRYLDLCFIGTNCIAFGSNTYQVSRVSVPCEITDIPFDYHLLVLPEKVPPRSRFIELHIDEKKQEYTIVYIDGEDEEIDASIVPFFAGGRIDYEDIFSKAQEQIWEYNHGFGKYHIAVNPKLLMAALDGMKSCDSVIFNFAGINQPFTVRPFDDDDGLAAKALIFPVKIP